MAGLLEGHAFTSAMVSLQEVLRCCCFKVGQYADQVYCTCTRFPGACRLCVLISP